MEFPNRLSSDQALDLERHFSKEEIKGAVWDCGLDKLPGPDGFTFGFYRRYWSLLEDEVVEAVNHFYNNGFCHKEGNSSFIALIPKTQGAKLVKDFRPISLIGSLYKIITKLLANRLVTVIGNLVNDVQSAFIADRQILDEPFILNELIHWCKAKKKETMIFKLSHLFYADDAIFIGQWRTSNIAAIIRVLECFFVLLAYALTFKKETESFLSLRSETILMIKFWERLALKPNGGSLSRLRGLELQTILCPSCKLAVESTDHLFFSCSMMKDLYASIAK
nr:cysteine-rich receptor-like protein kinase [Tanacetum cinerariifolium]